MKTIAAISTPHGKGGIAIIRLSGCNAIDIANRFMKHLCDHKPVFTCFTNENQIIDEVIATLYKAPHSYTGEDTVEISCHGSIYIQQTILQNLIDAGAELAQPGEFTRRAFFNGKLNLSQAEAVGDLIDSTSNAACQLALSQLRGGYQQLLATLRNDLIDLTSLLELELDFSQEDVEFADRNQLQNIATKALDEIKKLRHSFHLGNAIKQGIPVAIVGEPNAGKSSLLNALLHDDRAIVSDIAGTTRDTIEERISINGFEFRFIDTAGLRNTNDPIEILGVDRAKNALLNADIIIYVHDATIPLSRAHQQIKTITKLTSNHPNNSQKLIAVANKCDLINEFKAEHFVAVSAKTGYGIDLLTEKLTENLQQHNLSDVMLTNLRHYEVLGRAEEALTSVKNELSNNTPSDLVAVDLRDAIHHIGTITGEVTTNEILGTIFSKFCIGK